MRKLQLFVFSFLLYLSAVISDDVIQVERSDQKVLKFWQISDIHLDQVSITPTFYILHKPFSYKSELSSFSLVMFAFAFFVAKILTKNGCVKY